MTDIKSLRALLSRSSPGPWEVKSLTTETSRDGTAGDIGRIGERESLFTGEATYEGNHGLSADDEDKNLVVALVNAAPAILDELEETKSSLHVAVLALISIRDQVKWTHEQAGVLDTAIDRGCAALGLQRPFR